jgi:hypothetical protein
MSMGFKDFFEILLRGRNRPQKLTKPLFPLSLTLAGPWWRENPGLLVKRTQCLAPLPGRPIAGLNPLHPAFMFLDSSYLNETL